MNIETVVLLGLIALLFIVISFYGITQKKSSAIRLATGMAWVGPLPGYLCAMLYHPNTPQVYRNAQHESVLGLVLGLVPTYFAFALPMFGTYCFFVGFLSAWLIQRLKLSSLSVILQAAFFFGMGILAATPVIVMDGGISSDLGRAALVGATFWCVFFLLKREWIFNALADR